MSISAGRKSLYLVVRDGGDGFGCDWADWVEPKLIGPAGEKKLTDLKWKSASAGYGEVHINGNAQGNPIRVNDAPASFGLGTHSNSVIAYDLPAGYTRFQAKAALDDAGVSQGCGSTVQFLVFAEKPPTNIAVPSNQKDGSHELKDAIAGLDVAPGLEVSLFASEPMLANPHQHRHRSPRPRLGLRGRQLSRIANNGQRPAEGDRILILEDTDGDGKADKTNVVLPGPRHRFRHGHLRAGQQGHRLRVAQRPRLHLRRRTTRSIKQGSALHQDRQPQHDHRPTPSSSAPTASSTATSATPASASTTRTASRSSTWPATRSTTAASRTARAWSSAATSTAANFEVLAHNFRNNYEVAVDSFGTIWQSDNDDDGNRGVRINYVMEFGNYGYIDEMTGAGWQTQRAPTWKPKSRCGTGT